ncbi:UDP-N-acetylmuramoyl-L-alanyl-D-glutamate--2,6-diaminopimelate ligase [Rhodothermus profundi]|uniref:UDP-N-acetylmuramoyl-L-alanyl-D-glutamate--2,6-diaminopimelate ligase n=1 Tax=Rhodothermus profundi TaxID=633813 RepID=A0A1M6RFA5_9BACT|nr:UDP-N-acetylmuramoyl-L-alanyl-D-glutamate--2,6-diaminopimelate ligase [Rhodothermus profundi]SHK31142.1 UDP-N-acetylmuramoylalanyl-D-glutamate--2,6-diaminopimelate ligase [Rhodothermus profundi]
MPVAIPREPIPLTQVLQRLERAELLRTVVGSAAERQLTHLTDNSQEARAGGLFVAVRGERVDSHQFIDQAIAQGAVAVVGEAIPEAFAERFPDAVFIQVSNSRRALGLLATIFHMNPARRLRLIGITGTNGKTTTAFLVYHMLNEIDEETGLIGTISYRFGRHELPALNTTPGPIELNHLLRRMTGVPCKNCVMEVSSHALAQERVAGLPFSIAVFTNLTRDHLDYHGSFEAYLKAKKKLFDGLTFRATALYNIDDPSGPAVVADTQACRISYGQREEAQLRMRIVGHTLEGLMLNIDGRFQRFPLVGRFNAYNLLAAYGVGRAMGLDPDLLLEALAHVPQIPGRFERFTFEDNTTVIVDYAHTPDALENVLRAIREVMPEGARLWCIFGCGGERDRGKRPMMGAVAERLADCVIVTSDNPRAEDPEQIFEDIRQGMRHPEAVLWEVDRAQAIEQAAKLCRPGDVVLVAGKGHEAYQIIGTEKIPFDDRQLVQEFFEHYHTPARPPSFRFL